jgi:hypothetical protein
MSFNANIFLRYFSPILRSPDYAPGWSSCTYLRHSKATSHPNSSVSQLANFSDPDPDSENNIPKKPTLNQCDDGSGKVQCAGSAASLPAGQLMVFGMEWRRSRQLRKR